MLRLTAVLLSLLLGACSSQVYLTIESEPPGADVYEGKKHWGQSPITLAYTPSEEFTRGGCMGTSPIKVKWDTGAQAKVNTLNLCKARAEEQEFTFVYPETVEAEAGGRAVTSDGKLLYSNSDGSQDLRCSSNVNGGLVQTTCS